MKRKDVCVWHNGVILAVTLAVGFGLTYMLDFSSAAPPAQMAAPDSGAAPPPIKAGQQTPDFSFVTPDGQTRTMQDFRGRKVVLNFWASWCAPCVKEFPLFLEMAQANPDTVVFIALSSDFDESAMNRFLDKMRAQHKQAFSGENVLIALDKNSAIARGIFQTFRLPETILIDAQGVMREKLVGADWDGDDLEEMLRKI